MGKVSQQQAGKNRDAIVASASRLFREKGVDGVGVRELMAAAGLTQGALVGQFGTKDALVVEACRAAFAAADTALSKVASGKASGQAQRIAEYYLASKIPDHECPMMTLAGDSRRSGANSALREIYTDGTAKLARTIAGERRTPERLVLLAAMVGAAMLRHASDDASLTLEIISAVIDHSQKIS